MNHNVTSSEYLRILMNFKIMFMKTKILVTLALVFLAMANLSAQESDSGFRSQGYKGNVMYTNHYIVWQGVETSHGYMFNSHYYLGAGVGLFILPTDVAPVFGRVFAEYDVYFLDKGSTPTAGLKAGFCHSINYSSGNKFRNAAEIEPSLGWSWTLKSGKGLLLELGYPLYATSNTSIIGMPKISFGIEF